MQNNREQEQIQTEEIILTNELVKDLVELLGDKNPEVQHGTISAILQYTPTAEARRMFKNTPLISLLRKYVFTPKLTTISLSTLINFATEEEFLPEFFQLVEPLVFKMKEWQGLELQLSLLLLLNISKEEEIIMRIIGEGDKRGYLIEVLYAFLEKQVAFRWIVGGILVNLATIERGRKYLVQEKVYKRFIPSVISFDSKLRESSLKILRNCAFEWQDEQFSTQILKFEHNLINLLGKLMSFLISHKQLASDTNLTGSLINYYFTEKQYSVWEKTFEKIEKANALNEVELAIDTILILSNAAMKQKAVGANVSAFKELITALKFTSIQEETKDKLEALEIFGL